MYGIAAGLADRFDVPCGLQKILVLDIVLAEKLEKRPIWMEDDHVAVELWVIGRGGGGVMKFSLQLT
jgi:hypothetical protein